MIDANSLGLQVFDPIDLLRRTAALQLCPQNAQRLLRLEYLSGLIAALPDERGKPTMSSQRLRRTIDGGLGIGHLEDPVTWPFVESMAYFGGSYLVLPGLQEQVRPGLDLLLMSALLDPALNDLRAFRQSIAHPCQALLRLSNAICQKVGLTRAQAPGSSKQIVMPTGVTMETLSDAISWPQARLDELFSEVNFTSDALRPFETHLGTPSSHGVEPQDWALLNTPLLRHSDQLLVASPHALLTAMERYVLRCAQEHSVLDRLSRSFHDGSVRLVGQSLDLLGLPLIPHERHHHATPCLTQQFRMLDRDKILHVLVLSDDLSTYQSNHPADTGSYPDAAHLDALLATGIEDASKLNPPVDEILGMVVISGVGRTAVVGLNGGDVDQDVLPFNIQELATLAFLEPSNPLYIWHFARARRRMSLQTEMRAWSISDELCTYRSKDSSFYLTDEKIHYIGLLPNDGYTLLQEVQSGLDPHAIPMVSGGFQECVRVHHGSKLPIYCPRVPDMLPPSQCVEVDAGTIWVSATIQKDQRLSLANEIATRTVDAVAFWLARMSKSDIVVRAAIQRLHVEIITDLPNQWTTPTENSPGDQDIALPVIRVISTRHIQIVLQPDFMVTISRRDESPDKTLLLTLMNHLSSPQERAGTAVSDLLKKTMPTPYHRRIVTLTLDDTSAAIPRELPREHLVAVAAEQEILDGMSGIFDAISVVEGTIPREQRTSVLNAIVSQFYRLLVAEIALLSPIGLVEWMIAHNEATIDDLALARELEPFNIACFAEDAGSAKEFADRLTNLSKADQANRFLIELIAANPPCGSAVMSFAIYDRLMAIASKIISFGMMSDDIRYGSDDPGLARLPSGRLGISASNRQRARDQFMEAHGGGERARLVRHELVTDPEPIRKKRDRAYQAILDASEKELGFSLDTHAKLLAIVIEECVVQGRAVAEVSRNKLVARFATDLNASEEQARQLLDALCLGHRSDFFEVSSPADRNDVYPWKYNRRWSYLRRPFVSRGDSILCGSSSLFRAGTYLSRLCFSGRLKAITKEMKIAQGKMTEIAGYRFNATIAALVRKLPGILVKERSEQFGKVRLETLAGDDLGDIDVLAIDPRRRHIRAYECKDLSLARVPSEIANELNELVEGEKSIVAKHAKRVEWLRKHLYEVLAHFEIPSRGSWDVKGTIVVDEELVSSFLIRVPMKVLTIAEFERHLRERSELP